MAIEIFYSTEEKGMEGARIKAELLKERCGYRILNIEHGELPTSHAARCGGKEMGYKITIDNGRLGYD